LFPQRQLNNVENALKNGLISLLKRPMKQASLIYSPLEMLPKEHAEQWTGFQIQSLRHIEATHIIKNGGTWSDVASHLSDTEKTVRKHYVKWSPTFFQHNTLSILGY
jgi:hypothetical protein